MLTTVIELEFVELPDTPDSVPADPAGNGFLLSLWDASCRIATWRSDLQRFEDFQGLLNPAAIRAWAPLPQPVDAPAWGLEVVACALARDEARPDAGWLEPTHVAPSATP